MIMSKIKSKIKSKIMIKIKIKNKSKSFGGEATAFFLNLNPTLNLTLSAFLGIGGGL